MISNDVFNKFAAKCAKAKAEMSTNRKANIAEQQQTMASQELAIQRPTEQNLDVLINKVQVDMNNRADRLEAANSQQALARMGDQNGLEITRLSDDNIFLSQVKNSGELKERVDRMHDLGSTLADVQTRFNEGVALGKKIAICLGYGTVTCVVGGVMYKMGAFSLVSYLGKKAYKSLPAPSNAANTITENADNTTENNEAYFTVLKNVVEFVKNSS